MSIRELSPEEIAQLAGTRHAATGIEFPLSGLQPYYAWLARTLHLLAESSAGGLRVAAADASETSVRVAPGRASINGVALEHAGATLELAPHNNTTALIWLEDNAGAAAIGVAAALDGWPASPHVKLAEVTLEAGRVVSILDRRFESMLAQRVAAADADTPALIDDSGGTSNGGTVPLVVDTASAADATPPSPRTATRSRPTSTTSARSCAPPRSWALEAAAPPPLPSEGEGWGEGLFCCAFGFQLRVTTSRSPP